MHHMNMIQAKALKGFITDRDAASNGIALVLKDIGVDIEHDVTIDWPHLTITEVEPEKAPELVVAKTLPIKRERHDGRKP